MSAGDYATSRRGYDFDYLRDTLHRTRSYAATSRQTGISEITLRDLLATPPARPSAPKAIPEVPPSPLTPKELIMLCCAEEGVKYEDIIGHNRKRQFAWPRMRFMWVMRKTKPNLSLPDIGRRFSNRDHTTVISAIRRTEELYNTNERERERLDALVLAVEAHGKPASLARLEVSIHQAEESLQRLYAQREKMLSSASEN